MRPALSLFLPPTESEMRKILVILLGLFGCLLFCGGGGRTLAHDAGHVSVDRASDAVWLCEREYNADLNLPRVLGEVSPAPAAPVFQRGGHAESGPAADRYAADRHARGSTKVTSEFKSSDLSVGLHAVDYYVYRLCRLII